LDTGDLVFNEHVILASKTRALIFVLIQASTLNAEWIKAFVYYDRKVSSVFNTQIVHFLSLYLSSQINRPVYPKDKFWGIHWKRISWPSQSRVNIIFHKLNDWVSSKTWLIRNKSLCWYILVKPCLNDRWSLNRIPIGLVFKNVWSRSNSSLSKCWSFVFFY